MDIFNSLALIVWFLRHDEFLSHFFRLEFLRWLVELLEFRPRIQTSCLNFNLIHLSLHFSVVRPNLLLIVKVSIINNRQAFFYLLFEAVIVKPHNCSYDR
mgnify:CR=1 FL=1